jgi:WD40 repeat protein
MTILLPTMLLLPVIYRAAGAGECALEFSAHKLGVNALASVAAAGGQQQQQQQQSLLLSAGKDYAVRLWQISAGSNMQQQQQAGKPSKLSSSSSSSTSAHCAVVYKGHKEAVQSVALSPGADMCCSGGWDGQLLLWRTGGRSCRCYLCSITSC